MSQAQTIVPVNEVGSESESREMVPHLSPPRLPYHPAVQERFGVDRASWKALVEAIFPNASTVESVILALSYCRARKLDPFKRNVHIVPIWNRELNRLVDTIWPGIGELRTTAFRTGEYAGRSEAIFGPTLTKKVGRAEIIFPEWCQVTVFRIVQGDKREFAGPKVYWIETYATYKRDDDTPNEMWHSRPFGQIEKCAEAAALRAGFPEEIGSDYIPEEVVTSPRGMLAAAEIVAANGHTAASAIDALKPKPEPDTRSPAERIEDLRRKAQEAQNTNAAPVSSPAPAPAGGTTPEEDGAGSVPNKQTTDEEAKEFGSLLPDANAPTNRPMPETRGGKPGKVRQDKHDPKSVRDFTT